MVYVLYVPPAIIGSGNVQLKNVLAHSYVRVLNGHFKDTLKVYVFLQLFVVEKGITLS